MPTLIKRLEALMAEMGWEHADLVRVSGQSSSVVSQWLGKGSKEIKSIGKHEAAEAIANASGYSALWIAKGLGPQKLAARETLREYAYPGAPGVAQSASLLTARVNGIIPLAWEAIVSMSKREDLPPLFSLPLPDDAMAPRAKAGSVAVFSRDETPRPGDGVLLRDKTGTVYFRQYRQRRPGAWEAHALNESYQPLQSEADGLEILGVMTALEARWGN